MCFNQSKCVIGLIGGIGSGKSQVAIQLAKYGGCLIQADELGHQALKQPNIKQQLLQRWGQKICNEQGDIDRRQVGAIVFADPAERKALEDAVFPYIEQRMDEQIAEAQANPACHFIILDAAILLETGWGKRCHWIVYVHAPRPQRLRRIWEQRGWEVKEVQRRSKAQWSLTDKVTRAHFVVDNSGTLAELKHQVEQLLARPELSECTSGNRKRKISY